MLSDGFLLTRLSRGATACRQNSTGELLKFLLTRLSRGATLLAWFSISRLSDFYSRASREARLKLEAKNNNMIIFLLTRLSRGATGFVPRCVLFLKFLLTRLSRGATNKRLEITSYSRFLLTRLSRGATVASDDFYADLDISTHAPLARRDFLVVYCGSIGEFLLTRLSRGATATISSMIAVPHHISLEADFFSHSYHIFMPENRIFGY